MLSKKLLFRIQNSVGGAEIVRNNYHPVVLLIFLSCGRGGGACVTLALALHEGKGISKMPVFVLRNL